MPSSQTACNTHTTVHDLYDARGKQKAVEGSRRQQKAAEGSRRQQKAVEGSRRQQKAAEGSKRQQKAAEGSRSGSRRSQRKPCNDTHTHAGMHRRMEISSRRARALSRSADEMAEIADGCVRALLGSETQMSPSSFAMAMAPCGVGCEPIATMGDLEAPKEATTAPAARGSIARTR
eukprot:971113-Pleurochrysis_carterae.AAC.1